MTGSPESRAPSLATPPVASSPTWRGHLEIMRIDHWFKNVFVLPGVVVAFTLVGEWPATLWRNLVIGLLSIGFVASSNYVLNELLDAASDRHHPLKQMRPVPQGRVSIRLAYLQWIALALLGLALGWTISLEFTLAVAGLFAMGIVYNAPPIRSKDRPYLDVLSEAVNNPLRMLAGWAMVETNAVAPASLLLCYWMLGCYFMALKRYAELATLPKDVAAAYRRSFAAYDDKNLLTSILFYATAAMLFLGVFVMRYRLELILSYPLIAWVMAIYLRVGLQPDSPAQRPEHLWREPSLLVACVLCAAAMIVCLAVDMPWLERFVAPLAPTRGG